MKTISRYHLATDEWLGEFERLSEEEQHVHLFLSRHDRYTERWSVEGLDGSWILDLQDLVGKYRTVHWSKLDIFLDTCKERGYHAVFFEDPSVLIDKHKAYETTIPEFSLNSTLEGTIAGMLPFQLREFNKLREMPYGGFMVHDTGPQPVDEPVLTPSGWRPIGDLVPGDKVIGTSGEAISVIGVFPQGSKKLYRVHLSDGSTTRCSEDHLWTVRYWGNTSKKISSRPIKKTITEPLSSLVERGLFSKSGSKSSKRGRAKFSLPKTKAVEFQQAEPVWNPYILGLLLGDGGFSSGCKFSTKDPESVMAFEDSGISIIHDSRCDYRVNGIMPILRSLGLAGKRSWEKFVPQKYLYGSRKERLDILQGLLDSDGCASGTGASFTSTSYQLALDVVHLCRSLGGHATKPKEKITSYTYLGEKKTGRRSWRTQITVDDRLFRLERKENARKPYRQLYRNIVEIEDLKSQVPMVCISVDSPDHLYLTSDFVPTHNTGKTAVITALTKQKVEIEKFDLTLIVCKNNNKIDTQKKLLRLGDIDYSYILDGKASQKDGIKITAKQSRALIYHEILEHLDQDKPIVAILNYDKFRDDLDKEYLKKMVQDRKVLVIMDEMPTKLSNRKTALYKAVAEVLYGRDGKAAIARKNLRPSQMVQYCSTATPVQKSPVGVLNMTRLIDPERYPFIKEWERQYVARRDMITKEPLSFHNLDRMALELEDITSRVSKKDDPEVKALFPEISPERIELDLSDYDRKLYDQMGRIAIDLLEDPYSEEEISPLQLISVMQLICCAPSLISLSASRRDEFELMMEEWEPKKKDDSPPAATGSKAAQILLDSLDEEITDQHCEKLRALHEILETFQDEKVIIFSALAGYIQPVLRKAFDDWGITYEVYAGTDKQAQEAKDKFRSDPDIQVLLLSDKGSDGMDLPEAMVGVNFDLPWVWATKVQRSNRNNRVDSKLPINIWIDLVYRDTVEERKEEIISTKQGYHEDLYDGGTETSLGTSLTKTEIMYILRGDPQDQ